MWRASRVRWWYQRERAWWRRRQSSQCLALPGGGGWLSRRPVSGTVSGIIPGLGGRGLVRERWGGCLGVGAAAEQGGGDGADGQAGHDQHGVPGDRGVEADLGLATCRKFAPAARSYTACKLIADVGLRVNEACKLDLADVKWALGRFGKLHVRHVLTRVSARLSQGRRRLSAGVRTGGPVIDHENRPLIGLSVTEPARAVVYVARTFRCAMRAITDRGKNR